jgi:hypothetical protein
LETFNAEFSRSALVNIDRRSAFFLASAMAGAWFGLGGTLAHADFDPVAFAKLRAGEIARAIASSERDRTFAEAAPEYTFETGLLLQAGLRALLPIREREGVALPGTPSPNDPRELVEAQENYKAVFASGTEANPEQRAKAVRAVELAAERCERVGYTALARQVRVWLRTR